MTAPDYRTVTTQDDGTSGVGGVAQGARDRGIEVGEHAKSAAADVKDTAAERARDVADEARAQARDLVGHTRNTLVSHADEQTNRIAETLDELAGELHRMADSSDQNGLAGRVVGELAQRTDALALRMRGRSSTEILDDVRDLARRRPGAFLAGAAGLGLLVGRLGRGLKDAQSSDQQGDDAWSSSTYGEPYPAGTGYRTGSAYGATAGDYTSAGTATPGMATPGAATEYGTGAGLATPPTTGAEYGTGTGLGLGDTTGATEVGTPTYDTTALETARDGEYSDERDRPAGGTNYGA